MLNQHVRGRCTAGDGGDKKSVFYTESACVQKVRGRCAGGVRKVMVAFYAESACAQKVRGRCAEGDGGILC